MSLQVPNRRSFLTAALGAAGLGIGFAIPTVFATTKRPPIKALKFHNTHTGENLQAVFFANGKLVSEGYNKINWILRDFRAKEVKPIDMDLLNQLFDINRELETVQPFHIISGYRTPQTNNSLRRKGGGGVAKRSLHMDGRAIDIRIPRIAISTLHKVACSLKQGGVGIYSRSQFVHCDSGPVRYWGS